MVTSPNIHLANGSISPGAGEPSPAVPLLSLLQVAVLIIETLLLTLVLAGYSPTATLAGHLAMVAILVVTQILLEHSKLYSGEVQKFTLLTFVGGPIGAAAVILGTQRLGTHGAALRQDWYDTIAPPKNMAVTLVDRILDGRVVRREARLPRRFDRLLATGSMREKQALLAYIASQDGRIAAADVLRMALRSPDPRVRVQAAAVASHARSRARRAVTENMQSGLQSLSDAASSGPAPVKETGIGAPGPLAVEG